MKPLKTRRIASCSENKKYGFQVFETYDIVVASPKVLVFRAFNNLLDFRLTNHRNEGIIPSIRYFGTTNRVRVQT